MKTRAKRPPSYLAVARAFCRELARALSKSELAEVVRRNAAETDANVCHSHDFIDANMVMLRAYRRNGWARFGPLVMRPPSFRHESYAGGRALWSGAWDAAKAAGFDPEKVSAPETGREARP